MSALFRLLVNINLYETASFCFTSGMGLIRFFHAQASFASEFILLIIVDEDFALSSVLILPHPSSHGTRGCALDASVSVKIDDN